MFGDGRSKSTVCLTIVLAFRHCTFPTKLYLECLGFTFSGIASALVYPIEPIIAHSLELRTSRFEVLLEVIS
jgi:hypothetical protein